MNGQFPKSLILCSLFFALHAPLEAAKLYKWVDESGKVHYSDKIPPTAITGSHSKLSKEGVTVERRGAAKTPEEIAHEAELKRLREEQQRVLEKQQIKDRVLLNTFRTEDDIILARDGKLATYDAQIRIIYENIDRLKNRLISQQNRAALQERQGRKPDEKTLQGIENTQQEIKDIIKDFAVSTVMWHQYYGGIEPKSLIGGATYNRKLKKAVSQKLTGHLDSAH